MKQHLPRLPHLFLSLTLIFFSLVNDLVAHEVKSENLLENKFKAGGLIFINSLFQTNSVRFEIEQQVFELINLKRIEYGLTPLIWNEKTARVARLHSENMAEYRFFSHRGLDGRTVDSRADSIGLRKWRMIGENIASLRGYQEPFKHVIDCWMRSPGHRENLLREKWKESGVGIAVSPDGTYYFTQVFLKK